MKRVVFARGVKRKAIALSVFVALISCFLAFDLSRDHRSDVEKAFDERVRAHLQGVGDSIAVSALNPGDLPGQ